MLRVSSIVWSINCTDEIFFEMHDELCIKTLADKSSDEDRENSEFFVLSISKDSYDIRSSAKD